MPVPLPDDFSNVKEGFDPLPAGKYLVECTDAEQKTSGPDSKNPGTPYIAFEFTTQDEEYQGRKVWMNASFSPKALGMTKSAMRALGATDADFAGSEIDEEQFIGAKCYAIVAVGKNPKTELPNNNVKRLIPLSEEESELPS